MGVRDLMTAGAMVVVLAGTSAQAGGRDDAPGRFTRVRASDPELRRVIADGADRSATFLALAEEIQRSSGIVLVQFGQCPRGNYRSCVSGVEGDRRQRHIRVFVDTRTTQDRLVATVAHELQHAVEILRDPDAIDAEHTLALYRRIAVGKCGEGLSERCETEAARTVEAAVLDELNRAGTRRAALPPR
jgi:23S rRNA G2445 N2-methylase RlmL